MLRLILHWVLSALVLILVARVVPGIEVSSVGAALLAVIVIGLVNATLGVFLKVLTFPLTIITLGIFWFVINALMLEVASLFVPGFHVRGFGPALIASLVLALINMIIRRLTSPREQY